MSTKSHLLQTSFCLVFILVALCGCKKSDYPYNVDYLAVQMSKEDGWSIIDKNGKEVVKEEYSKDSKISKVYDGTFWVFTDDTAQLFSVDQPKKPLVDEEFARATAFEAGVAAVSNPNKQIRLINTKGETVATLDKNIKRCYGFNKDGYAIVASADNKAGVIDTKGNLVVPMQYADMKLTISENLVFVRKKTEDKKLVIIDMSGKEVGAVDEEKYDLLNSSIKEGKIIVRESENSDATTIVLDKTGKKLFDIKKAKDKYYSYGYLDDYLVFNNGESKYGVVDDKGEVVIRAKYDDMFNYGSGRFLAKKGEKWGVVNEKDEIILDFDYDVASYFIMGDNSIMKDGSDWSLIGKDGKEITSFYDYSSYASDYAEYVDVEGLANNILKFIEKCEQPQTAAAFAQEHSLSVNDYHYRSYFGRKLEYDDKVTGTVEFYYQRYVAEEKTHIEDVNDGWFTYKKVVSDGWAWTDAMPRSVSGSFVLSINAGIKIKDLYDAVISKLKDGRRKISDETYSKAVKFGGQDVECNITVSMLSDKISLSILYLEDDDPGC